MQGEIKNFKLNFGPQHPAAHGVLRLIVELEGERVVSAEPHIGLLHRGSEKLMENKIYHQNSPYFERMDYICPLTQPYAYSLAIEKTLNLDVPKRAKYLRMLVAELSRIFNHAIAIGAIANDIGAITPFIIQLEVREQLFEFFEFISGARMHGNYIRPGGVSKDVPKDVLDRILSYMDDVEKSLDDTESLLSDNRIFKQRLADVGSISSELALEYGFTGPNLRASGVNWDLRKSLPYDCYNEVEFDVAIGKHGDSYDRYAIRVFEVRESIKIIKQLLNNMPDGEVKCDDHKYVFPKRSDMEQDMESLIHHFKLHTEGYKVPEGEIYMAVETPKGEFGVYLVSDGTNKPYRVKVRTTCVPHLSALNELTRNHLLADIPVILGSIDIIFGEADR